MKKLTIALVALLLALTCLFVACNNDKPTDKPVEEKPVETVSREILVAIAEQLKLDYRANYVDLYSNEVANEIDAQKSLALLKISRATTEAEARDVATAFIDFLKAQKTSADEVKDLIAKIAEVDFDDEEDIIVLKAYNNIILNTVSTKNAVKKAALEAYKTDAEVQDAIAAIVARLASIKATRDAANAEDGLNAELAALKDKVLEDGRVDLYDEDKLNALTAKVVAAAEDAEIDVDSDLYKEIYNVAALDEVKALLKDAKENDSILKVLADVMKATDALVAAADDARYVEYYYVDKTGAVAGQFETKEAALAAEIEEENVEEVVAAVYYKLSLKAALDAVDTAKAALEDIPSMKLEKYGTNSEVYKAAEATVAEISTAYAASLAAAKEAFAAAFDLGLYVNADLAKDPTYGTAVLDIVYNAENDTPDYKLSIAKAIDELVKSFKNAEGEAYVAGLVDEGDYTAEGTEDEETYGPYKFFLDEDGKVAVKYVAWTYTYQLAEANDLNGAAKYDVAAALEKDPAAAKAQAALDWLVKFIGDGEYAEVYDLTEYDFAAKLYMTDRAVTEVATAGVAAIGETEVADEKTAALEAVVVSPYTIAKDVIAEYARVKAAEAEAAAAAAAEQAAFEAAKAAAIEEVKAAALALRTAGDANAIAAAEELYTTTATDYKCAAELAELTVVVKAAATEEEADTTVKVIDLINAAKGVLAKLEAVNGANEETVAAALVALKGFVETYNADFINAVTATTVEEVTTEVDNLTNLYKVLTVLKVNKFADDVVAFAKTKNADAKLTAGTISWLDAAKANVAKQTITVAVVTSVDAANEALEAFALADDVYDLEFAVELINDLLDAENQLTVETLKAGIDAMYDAE